MPRRRIRRYRDQRSASQEPARRSGETKPQRAALDLDRATTLGHSVARLTPRPPRRDGGDGAAGNGPAVQRVIYSESGVDDPFGMGSAALAKHYETVQAAKAIREQTGQALEGWPSAVDLTPGRNFFVGHSAGTTFFGKSGPELADALLEKNVQHKMKIRLVGCDTANSDSDVASIIHQTAQALRTKWLGEIAEVSRQNSGRKSKEPELLLPDIVLEGVDGYLTVTAGERGKTRETINPDFVRLPGAEGKRQAFDKDAVDAIQFTLEIISSYEAATLDDLFRAAQDISAKLLPKPRALAPISPIDLYRSTLVEIARASEYQPDVGAKGALSPQLGAMMDLVGGDPIPLNNFPRKKESRSLSSETLAQCLDEAEQPGQLKYLVQQLLKALTERLGEDLNQHRHVLSRFADLVRPISGSRATETLAQFAQGDDPAVQQYARRLVAEKARGIQKDAPALLPKVKTLAAEWERADSAQLREFAAELKENLTQHGANVRNVTDEELRFRQKHGASSTAGWAEAPVRDLTERAAGLFDGFKNAARFQRPRPPAPSAAGSPTAPGDVQLTFGPMTTASVRDVASNPADLDDATAPMTATTTTTTTATTSTATTSESD